VSCLSKQESLVQEFGFGNFAENVFVIERDGKVVSACVSTRENEQCGEAWVYTDPKYRKHGFAHQVVRAWARQILKAGKVPFYSHKIENTASAHLAKRLEL
jgi:predicted GNAT family acetyltransferase